MKRKLVKKSKLLKKRSFKKYKKLKTEILNRYDKNNDNIISIKEYLARETSIGPREKKGNISYHYQSVINVYNFFTLLVLKKIKAFKIMCIPQFEVKFGRGYIERTTALYDIYRHQYYFPESMIDSIHSCLSNGIRLIYFTFIIMKTNEGISHANIVIIDLKKKTLERFEPYGCTVFYKKDVINKFFKSFVLKFLQLKKYKYLAPENLSPKLGIQHGSDSYSGMCVTISAMYLQMRILNVDIKQKKIVEHFLKMSEKKLKSIILKFAKYIEKTLKKDSKTVNKLNYNLYDVIYNEI